MKQVLIYSLLLLSGIITSQVVDFSHSREILNFVTMVFLSYIMTEVGLEFTLDRKNLKSYGVDYLVAATAAAFPWIFCAIYYVVVFHEPIAQALLLSRFASPTSAGVLFTLLAAAGLGTTWVFKKARILAIFDDLDTILLMIPLKMLLIGLKLELFWIVLIIAFLLWFSFKFMRRFRLPIGKFWLFGYGLVATVVCKLIEVYTHIHIEVLLPAFVLGSVLYNPHDPNKPQEHPHEHTHIEPETPGAELILDRLSKASFMFLVGCSLPKMDLSEVSLGMTVFHVLIVTLLANLGKCFPAFCYSKEASLKERIALSIAMFPRGEVGGGVLLVSISYGIGGFPVTLSGLSLALNLVMTGFFIAAVIKLLESQNKQKV